MPDARHSLTTEEKLLGMDQPITRRDSCNASMLAAGAVLLETSSHLRLRARNDPWDGDGGIGDYATSHGNTADVVRAAHQIRDGVFDSPPADAIDSGELFDCVVIGGGLSGLSAAYHFRKAKKSGTCLVIENHPIFGGESKQNEFIVRGQFPLGATLSRAKVKRWRREERLARGERFLRTPGLDFPDEILPRQGQAD